MKPRYVPEPEPGNRGPPMYEKNILERQRPPTETTMKYTTDAAGLIRVCIRANTTAGGGNEKYGDGYN